MNEKGISYNPLTGLYSIDADEITTTDLNAEIHTVDEIQIYDINDTYLYRIFSQVGLAANRICYLPLLTGNDTFVFNDFAATLTNKTISRASNTLTNLNIVDADVSTTANINATKIGTGIVDNTEFNYISNLDQSLSTTNNVVFNNITANVGLYTDIINEITLNAGVTTEGILLKDSAISGATIDSDLNTITNIVDADIKSTANITWTKLQYHQLTGSNWGIGNGALDSTIGGALNNLAIGTLALTALTTADQCVAIGENAGQSITTNGGNLLIGYSCMKGLAGNVLSINNTCMGNNIMLTNNASNCNSNFLLGGGIFLNSTGANSNNILIGVENMRNMTSSSNSNNTSLGYRNCMTLTTGSLNNSILLGDSISAPAATSVLSDIIVIGRNQTLRASPLTAYLQLGTTTQTQFYCPITSLNTDGVLKTASNIISSALLVNADVSATANIDATKIGTGVVDNTEFNYLNGLNQSLSTTSTVTHNTLTTTSELKSDTINEYTTNNGVLIDLVEVKDGGITLSTSGGTPQQFNYYEHYQYTSTWSSLVWSNNGTTPGTQSGSFYIIRSGSIINITLIDVYANLGISPVVDFIYSTTTIPSRFRPTNTQRFWIRGLDNGAYISAMLEIRSTGEIYIYSTFGGATFSITGGQDGFYSTGISYHIL